MKGEDIPDDFINRDLRIPNTLQESKINFGRICTRRSFNNWINHRQAS
jgi:hypothetical protein